MWEDEKSKTKCDYEKAVPCEKEDESLENLQKHGDVNVVLFQLGMSPNQYN